MNRNDENHFHPAGAPETLRESLARAVDNTAGDTGETPPTWHEHVGPDGIAIATPEAVFRALEGGIGLPNSLAHCSFANFRQLDQRYTSFMEYSKRWAEGVAAARLTDRGHSLFLSGSTGTGKTHLAVACLRQLAYQGFRPKFLDCQELMMELRGYSSDGLLYECIDADIALFDDIWSTKPSEVQAERMQVILSKRIAHRRPTIITSNIPFPSTDADKLFGHRLMSRIRGSYCYANINLPDYRIM